jgi:hypothetical protein
MSLVVELYGKAGKVCEPSYRRGVNCPLIARTTSEDLLVGTVFGVLRRMRPVLWLRPMLTQAFAVRRFVTCPMRDLDVRFWPSLPPPSARAHNEGMSEPDLVLQFGRALVLVEAKYNSDLSARTTHDANRDQLLRLIDVAYHATRAEQFATLRREPWVLVIGIPTESPRLLSAYQNRDRLHDALGPARSDVADIAALMHQRLGYVSWSSVADVLRAAGGRARGLEQALLRDLVEYIEHRVRTAARTTGAPRQGVLPVMDNR